MRRDFGTKGRRNDETYGGVLEFFRQGTNGNLCDVTAKPPREDDAGRTLMARREI